MSHELTDVRHQGHAWPILNLSRLKRYRENTPMAVVTICGAGANIHMRKRWLVSEKNHTGQQSLEATAASTRQDQDTTTQDKTIQDQSRQAKKRVQQQLR